jgi:curved DNA-binding protein CbpA
MEGQLNEHPLAELIREITTAGLSGALRLERERASVAIYFENGELVFAASNLRAHRLREIVKRGGLGEAQMSDLPAKASDDELAEALIQSGRVTADTLAIIRRTQVSDVLRLALLWTNGRWEFDPRVRLADDVRVSVDVNRLLLECARHLPASFVASRFAATNGVTYLGVNSSEAEDLFPTEAFVLSRASHSVTVGELTALSGVSEEESYRAIYALSLSGLLQRSDWPCVFGAGTSKALHRRSRTSSLVPAGGINAVEEFDEAAEVQALFARLESAKDHYDLLDIARFAGAEEIKSAYHTLARRFHPDRFHNSDSALRSRVNSAFAHIAQAYETLSDSPRRAFYDAKLGKSPTAGAMKIAASEKRDNLAATTSAKAPESERAESSFQQGLAALQRKQRDVAIRLLAEAATLAPREARYRAGYGHALIGETNASRLAEGELQAAVSLEPDNASHRVMLAELYKTLGLRRRAQSEVERALAADPQNQAARALLTSLKNKS